VVFCACPGWVACLASGPETPDDLRLTAEETARSEALSRLAWGFFLQIRGKGAPGEFLRHYQEALRLAPDSELALERLITPWLVEEDYARIVETLTPIAASAPHVPRLHLVVAEALAAQGKTDEAVATLETAIDKLKIQDPRLFRELFVSYWRQKRYDDIERLLGGMRRTRGLGGGFIVEYTAAIFHSAMAQSPGVRTSPWKRKRLERRALRHARRAAELLEQADEPDDVESLAELLITLDAWEDANDLLRQARGHEELYSVELDLILAQGLQRHGKHEESLTILREASQHEGLRPRLYPKVAHLFLEAEQLDEACILYKRALLSYPKALGVRLKLAYLHLRRRQPERALELLETAEKLPAEGHFIMSHAYRRLKRTEDAAKALAQAEALALKSENTSFFSVDFYMFFATLCDDLGYTERSIEKIRKALELDPVDPVCANFLGYVLADSNQDLDEAEKWVGIALAAEPENYAYLDSIAWVYYRQKRYAEALVEINRALRLAGREPDPVILDHAGDIYAANGLWLLARRYWRAALAAGAKKGDKIQEKIDRAPPITPETRTLTPEP